MQLNESGGHVQKRAAGLSALLLLAAVVLGGCATAPEPAYRAGDSAKAKIDPDSLILSGRLFGATDADLEVHDADILAVDEDMVRFVNEKTSWVRSSDAKLHQLLRGMVTKGLLSLEYDPHITHTARETFHSYTGNCLSFTNLFVALAREAGLDVKFQMVDIPPEWLGNERLVILNNHINVRVRTKQRRDYVVDFNIDDYKGNYPKRLVSDDYALALYYSNMAVKYLTEGDNAKTFAYLRKSIQTYPRIPGPWINLGVLYSRHGAYDEAEAAYRKALKLDHSNKSALTNLASLFETKGDREAANFYQRRVRYYRERNPYYHFWLARQSLAVEDYAGSLQHIHRALQLKQDEHQFYHLQALAYFRSGNTEAAKASLVKANKYVQFEELKKKYNRKIAALGGS